MERSIDFKIIILLSVFISSIIVANLISGVKLVNLLGFIVPVGFLAYAITFPITDIIDEIYGKKLASYFVWAGFIANIVSLVLIWLGYAMPPLQPSMQTLYSGAFVPMTRIVFASMIAYLISQNHDVWAFMFWRKKTNGKWLWLRNNASTMVSQLIDTVIFITIAFYGVVPTNILLTMIGSQYLWKVIVALCDTPFVYAGVYILRRSTGRFYLAYEN